MTVSEILRGVELRSRRGSSELLQKEVAGLHYDSRKIQPGFVFVAMKGGSTNGNRYIDAAIKNGAIAIISDCESEPVRASVAWAMVTHGRRALAELSATFYGHPEQKLKISGVTGTNGKTTTTFLLSQILRLTGRGEVALIGTVEYQYAGKTLPAPHTTPEPLEIQQILAEATNSKLGKIVAKEAVMEVSSHALAQERTWGLPLDVAIFTNLTRDHLDFHGSMEEYFAAKQKLFAGCGASPPRVAVINVDDEYGKTLIPFARQHGSEVVSYGIKNGDLRAQNVKPSSTGMAFILQSPSGSVEIRSTLVGRVNVYNLLAASAGAMARGATLEELAAAVPRCHAAAGRFERVDCGQPFTVIVDYAHTDDALRNLTAIARDVVSAQPRRGRVITLFGCGGDRDRSKRPLMARAAAEGSDFVVLTSDNPRSEVPVAIIEEALPGLRATGTAYEVEPDRKSAIALAIKTAQPGDIVLIAGKGHEKVQVLRTGAVPFDDVQVTSAALAALGFSPVPAAASGESA